jgi:tripartite-type tricarboxylate transporter receptor subunit TctC
MNSPAVRMWAAALLITSMVQNDAWAQAYPSKPITVVVPFAAGGPSDTLARVMTERMRESIGQPFIIAPSVLAAWHAPIRMATRW